MYYESISHKIVPVADATEAASKIKEGNALPWEALSYESAHGKFYVVSDCHIDDSPFAETAVLKEINIVEKNAISDWVNEISKDIPTQFTLPVAELTNALDAMHWCFSPYLDNSDLSEFPWIINLIKSYNSIVSILPTPWNLQYEPVEY